MPAIGQLGNQGALFPVQCRWKDKRLPSMLLAMPWKKHPQLQHTESQTFAKYGMPFLEGHQHVCQHEQTIRENETSTIALLIL
jgi:hypothetical protein